MRSALYYPHTKVENVNLVKNALLLWDKLEYIVPTKDFRSKHGSRDVQRAMEIIGKAHFPTKSEKAEVHALVEDMVTSSLPQQFYFADAGEDRRNYKIYPDKLLDQTWNILQQFKLSGEPRENANFPMSEPAGLMVMSILADCCAGKTRARVTDRGPAYATLAGLLRGNVDEKLEPRRTPREHLVHISLQVINTGSLGIQTLIEFREREEKESGHTLRDLRHRYVANLETYVKRLTTEGGSPSDAKEIKRQFADDMRIDLAQLKKELGSSGREALLSKDILLTVFAAAESIAAWAFGMPVPIAGTLTAAGLPASLIGGAAAANKYNAARRTTMQKHPMAYLYELKGSPRQGHSPSLPGYI